MRERVTERKSRSLRQKHRRDHKGHGVGVGSLGASGAGFGDDFAENLDGAFAAGAVDVEVRDKTDGVGCGVERPDAVRLQGFAELNGVEAGGFAVEDGDIGFDNGGSEWGGGGLV